METPDQPKNKLLPFFTGLYTFVGTTMMLGAILLIFFPLTIEAYYLVNTNASSDELQALTIDLADTESTKRAPKRLFSIPPLDPSLPTENRIIITKMGLDGKINENSNADLGLKSGIWRVNNFGSPEEVNLPIIIAAHRFGYTTWSRDFRQHNTFYKLPDTKVGDVVTIRWGQRIYKYEITRVTEGTQIDDYTSDLILYTCKFLKSPERILRYAKRIE
jgi:sortase (surface protein transpeptidase)